MKSRNFEKPKSSMPRRNRGAFTLIELLIVVAIIAILAAIAVPNFLEAQTRAKVSRCMADMRTFATAIELYSVDWNRYALDGAVLSDCSVIYPTQNPSDAVNLTKFAGPPLTTPIAYLQNQSVDPFAAKNPQQEFRWYFYSNLDQASSWLQTHAGMVPPMIQVRMNTWGRWMLMASGPDRDRLDVGASVGPVIANGYYDPTNGTTSNGDVIMSQRMTSIPK